MSDRGYLKQKLYEAVNDLFTDKGLEMGLTYAATYILHVRKVPEEFRAEFEQIKADLLAALWGRIQAMFRATLRLGKRTPWRDGS